MAWSIAVLLCLKYTYLSCDWTLDSFVICVTFGKLSWWRFLTSFSWLFLQSSTRAGLEVRFPWFAPHGGVQPASWTGVWCTGCHHSTKCHVQRLVLLLRTFDSMLHISVPHRGLYFIDTIWLMFVNLSIDIIPLDTSLPWISSAILIWQLCKHMRWE
jgi:hypothetical protein